MTTKQTMTELEIADASTRKINAFYRSNDESHLWPICGKFNVTERAIRSLRKTQLYKGGYEYYITLDYAISDIVNAEV